MREFGPSISFKQAHNTRTNPVHYREETTEPGGGWNTSTEAPKPAPNPRPPRRAQDKLHTGADTLSAKT